ncbi:hypothetical protein E2C01_042379 [Portunus trituberculatus]|uniref:Uncharacterized protein n=1 Tax=Portunus trituberculatus TaxID=210409 RepID=A0A5B7FMA8_PORTR|nr:hypothetical protein [Portunus trituberculatus]
MTDKFSKPQHETPHAYQPRASSLCDCDCANASSPTWGRGSPQIASLRTFGCGRRFHVHQPDDAFVLLRNASCSITTTTTTTITTDSTTTITATTTTTTAAAATITFSLIKS